ncbi:MAG: RNA polymerase factor sigma-54 [Chlorobi bacterium]|nr:RNA polymerase factor sigma-54 [Chlorobiota bacterium]MCI0717139.1 RNA polymerase factor sigma-54 [Chlorobiota bacterium]
MLKNIQGQYLQQKLSPQAIQAQLLLAIPTLALEQEIKKQLEDNPMLEDSADVDTGSNDEAELSSEKEDEYGIDEWNKYSEPREFARTENEDRTEYLINKQAKLKETPLEQLYRLGLDNEQIIIGEEILGSLDDDGYLRESLEGISEDIKKKYDINVSINEIENVLKIIQKLDPIGIASRNLQECLTVQLEELEIDSGDKQLAIKMINVCFDEFSHKHFEKLSKLLNVPLEKVSGLFEIIHRLNPVPGKQNIAADYVYPDFIVRKTDGKLQIELNEDSNPRVRISKRYLDLLKAKDTEKETREFLKNKLDSAKWFLNAIQSRKNTMLKVMNAIVKRQKEFFESSGENLKPMFEKDIADEINMDVSTVSRVVRGKYVQTDFGIYELKYFFSSAMHTGSGEDVSNKMVKEKIREMIDSEDKSKPLSDEVIAEMMNKSGFPLARRTVAKYRESMKIPKATMRRKIAL